MLKNLCVLAACVLVAIPLTAQSFPSAEGPGVSVWVGASISMFNPDYGCTNDSPLTCWNHQLLGITPYVYTNPFLFHRIGAEGEARFLHWRGPGKLTQASYMAGPRIGLYRYKKLLLSGRFMVGEARLDVGAGNRFTGNYFAYAPGGTLDFRMAKRVSTRIDYEYQRWPTFKGILPGNNHTGLTPNGLSVGVSYAIR
jgi:hypothetical protein